MNESYHLWRFLHTFPCFLHLTSHPPFSFLFFIRPPSSSFLLCFTSSSISPTARPCCCCCLSSLPLLSLPSFPPVCSHRIGSVSHVDVSSFSLLRRAAGEQRIKTWQVNQPVSGVSQTFSCFNVSGRACVRRLSRFSAVKSNVSFFSFQIKGEKRCFC